MMELPQILQAIGLSVGFVIAVEAWHAKGGTRESAAVRLILAAPLIFAGGKAWYLVENRLPPTAANLLSSGYSLFGSLLLVLLFWALWSRLRPFPLLRFLDAVTPAAAAGLVFGRLSCYLRGCCSGLPTDLPWGIRLDRSAELFSDYVVRGWTDASLRQTVPLHPTQLYEAAFAAVAFFLLRYASDKGLGDGRVCLVGALSYGFFRLVVEPFRLHTTAPTTVGSLFTAQWAALAATVAAAAGLWVLGRRKPLLKPGDRLEDNVSRGNSPLP